MPSIMRDNIKLSGNTTFLKNLDDVIFLQSILLGNHNKAPGKSNIPSKGLVISMMAIPIPNHRTSLTL